MISEHRHECVEKQRPPDQVCSCFIMTECASTCFPAIMRATSENVVGELIRDCE
ncbi:hypothetical protein KIN20_009468 [Parelaphostrongylus tenuis]|uniref:Uncharacterized protein n=1 Tax=Parelaphostrongylus tenuis TaxID=148309 RepID=A0AAD5M6F0_PARTN|nr:hypothetical protein KIN20_009468 [Parelaphostrongylus tenuis]